MDPADLERLIARELRSLPAPRAPRTLLPRVMAAATAAAERPWYSRAWLQWPVGWQLIRDAVEAISFVANVRSDVASSAREVETATSAVRVLWRTLLAPVVPWAFALVTLMGAACAVFGTALNHLVFGRAFR